MVRRIGRTLLAAAAVVLVATSATAEVVVWRPYAGVTLVRRSESNPRGGLVTLQVALIELHHPGIRFAVTPHAGSRETRRQTTVDFVREQHASLGINVAFFNPVVPAERVEREPGVFLAGFIASNGQIVSEFDPQPADSLGTVQSYAIVPYAPAINLDPENRLAVVHYDAAATAPHIREAVRAWNAVSGSAQIITDGRNTVPEYRDASHPAGLLTPRAGNPSYDNGHSWYDVSTARTAIGFTQDGQTLVLLVADRVGDKGGMTVGEVARVLLDDYHCFQALNLDGGGSSAMALRDPLTGEVRLLNVSADAAAPGGRAAGANLAVFAVPVEPKAEWVLWVLAGVALLVGGVGASNSRRE